MAIDRMADVSAGWYLRLFAVCSSPAPGADLSDDPSRLLITPGFSDLRPGLTQEGNA